MVDTVENAYRIAWPRSLRRNPIPVPKGGILPPSASCSAARSWICSTCGMLFFEEFPLLIHPAFQSNDYWVLVNSNALPRVFVPKSVATVKQ